ncbi:MAG TPA: hypothetical protein VLJ10_03215 [Candidatus Bathyarchaeia archaeon]|nr:hypothetical protein [Candidatus Bathyarchaeia archaeon]
MKFTKQGQQVIEYLLVFGAVVATALTVSPYVGRKVDQTMSASLNELQSEIHSYSWAKGACGPCSVDCGGGKQNCTTVCMRSDGLEVDSSFCEGTPPTFTQDCNAQPCPIHCLWGEWVIGECLPTCGTGRSHTDTKEIITEAQFGGEPCDPADGVRELDCPDLPCPGDCGNTVCETDEQTTCPQDCGCQFQFLQRNMCNGCGGTFCEKLNVAWHNNSTCEALGTNNCACGPGEKPIGSLTLISMDINGNCNSDLWGQETYWVQPGYTCESVKPVLASIPPCCGDGVRNGSEECEEEYLGFDEFGDAIIDCSGLPEYSYPANLDCYPADPMNVDLLECTYDKSDCFFVCKEKATLSEWCDAAHHDDGLTEDLGPVTYYTEGSCPAESDTCQAHCLTNLVATPAGDGCECPTSTDVYCSSTVNAAWDDDCHECCQNADCPSGQVCDRYKCYDRTEPCSWCWEQMTDCDSCGGTACCPRDPAGMPFFSECERYYGSHGDTTYSGCNCPEGEVPSSVVGAAYPVQSGDGVLIYGIDCQDVAAGYTCVPYDFQYATFETPDPDSCCGDKIFDGDSCECPGRMVDPTPMDNSEDCECPGDLIENPAGSFICVCEGDYIENPPDSAMCICPTGLEDKGAGVCGCAVETDIYCASIMECHECCDNADCDTLNGEMCDIPNTYTCIPAPCTEKSIDRGDATMISCSGDHGDPCEGGTCKEEYSGSPDWVCDAVDNEWDLASEASLCTIKSCTTQSMPKGDTTSVSCAEGVHGTGCDGGDCAAGYSGDPSWVCDAADNEWDLASGASTCKIQSCTTQSMPKGDTTSVSCTEGVHGTGCDGGDCAAGYSGDPSWVCDAADNEWDLTGTLCKSEKCEGAPDIGVEGCAIDISELSDGGWMTKSCTGTGCDGDVQFKCVDGEYTIISNACQSFLPTGCLMSTDGTGWDVATTYSIGSHGGYLGAGSIGNINDGSNSTLFTVYQNHGGNYLNFSVELAFPGPISSLNSINYSVQEYNDCTGSIVKTTQVFDGAAWTTISCAGTSTVTCNGDWSDMQRIRILFSSTTPAISSEFYTCMYSVSLKEVRACAP